MVLCACGSEESKNSSSSAGLQGPVGSSGPQGPSGAPGQPGESFQQATQKLFEKLRPRKSGVVDLLCGSSNGTGTRISEDTVVTAYHVLSGHSSCVVRSNGLQVANGGSLSRSASGRDIGYVRNLSFSVAIPVIPLVRNAAVADGNLLALLSYPSDLRNDLQTSIGFVTDDNAQSSLGNMGNEWRDAIISDMAAGPGSSGGPIFDIDGNFIGVHVGGYGNNAGGVELNFQLIFSASD